MAVDDKGIPQHLNAKHALMASAKTLARVDGSLPPERELAKMLGVCRATLRKALDDLISDSFIVNVPRQGNFLTGASPRLQVALLSSGFNIGNPSICAGALRVFGGTPSLVCVIHVKAVSEIPSLYRDYGLAGALFIQPNELALTQLANQAVPFKTPLISALPFFRADMFPLKSDYVFFEPPGTIRAQFMIARGHRRIIYAGRTTSQTYKLFKKALAEAGIEHDPKLCADDDELVGEQIRAILDDAEATALVADGGTLHLERIFQTVASHPKGANLELELPDIPDVKDLRRRFPNIKVIGLLRHPFERLGEVAANALLEKMRDGGRKMEPIGIPSTIIGTDEERL